MLPLNRRQQDVSQNKSMCIRSETSLLPSLSVSRLVCWSVGLSCLISLTGERLHLRVPISCSSEAELKLTNNSPGYSWENFLYKNQNQNSSVHT